MILARDTVHVFCEHLSAVDEPACNPKPKSLRQTGRYPFNAGHNDLAKDRHTELSARLGGAMLDAGARLAGLGKGFQICDGLRARFLRNISTASKEITKTSRMANSRLPVPPSGAT
jgi:hypothetical protein